MEKINEEKLQNKVKFSACFVDLARVLGIKIEHGEVSIVKSMLDVSQMTQSVKSLGIVGSNRSKSVS